MVAEQKKHEPLTNVAVAQPFQKIEKQHAGLIYRTT
jgi:hypothetical protein